MKNPKLKGIIGPLKNAINAALPLVTPLDGVERDAIAKHWAGGPVRRLRRIVGGPPRERDIRASRN
ncbi:hypothetical protein [Bradyrhizobium sp. F1.4.3]|uniref:hypothetical protein n=1 Tax=Bradyrhizobium sp. F1.4.3 TaxID=3156356 RepID=UPI003393A0F6